MDTIPGFVSTKGSNINKHAASQFESVVYSGHRKATTKTTKLEKSLTEENNSERQKRKALDIRKLRYEVIKFGTSGLNPIDKEASSVALAVALGAKPPKKKYQNYKEILESKKVEKRNKTKPPILESRKQHLYVVGSKVIPAKPRNEEGAYKKLLDGYGKPGKSSFKRKKKNRE